MKPVIKDFVNRDWELGFLWKMTRQEVEYRILVVEGESGMGKTYLLDEFRAECRDKGIELVYLNFDERYEDPGYMYVVKEIMGQLGPQGFDYLLDTMDEIIQRSLRKKAKTSLNEVQTKEDDNLAPAEHEPAPLGDAPLSQEQLTDTVETTAAVSPRAQVGRSGGVNIYDGTHSFRDVAGREIVHFVQVINQEDPYVQGMAPGWIAEALQWCLEQITSQRDVIFFFDHWEKCDKDTRKWIALKIINWAADKMRRACVVLAGIQGLDLEPRGRMEKVLLPELEEKDIYTYLVDVYSVDEEKIPGIIDVTGGMPMSLHLYVKRNKLTARAR